MIRLTELSTPLGPMIAGATDEALCLLEFADGRRAEAQLERVAKRLGAAAEHGTTPGAVVGESPIAEPLAAELARYFAGELREFTVPLHAAGTAFQEAVWAELLAIPYGATRSYGEQARRLGRPDAVRAVARANGDNPIAILVPCHRVIGADGSLTGYGGGLWRKRRLLELESGQGSLLD